MHCLAANIQHIVLYQLFVIQIFGDDQTINLLLTRFSYVNITILCLPC